MSPGGSGRGVSRLQEELNEERKRASKLSMELAALQEEHQRLKQSVLGACQGGGLENASQAQLLALVQDLQADQQQDVGRPVALGEGAQTSVLVLFLPFCFLTFLVLVSQSADSVGFYIGFRSWFLIRGCLLQLQHPPSLPLPLTISSLSFSPLSLFRCFRHFLRRKHLSS